MNLIISDYIILTQNMSYENRHDFVFEVYVYE